jgi:hypothetical protein
VDDDGTCGDARESGLAVHAGADEHGFDGSNSPDAEAFCVLAMDFGDLGGCEEARDGRSGTGIGR